MSFIVGGIVFLVLVEALIVLSLWEFFTLTGIRLHLWQKLLLILLAAFPGDLGSVSAEPFPFRVGHQRSSSWSRYLMYLRVSLAILADQWPWLRLRCFT